MRRDVLEKLELVDAKFQTDFPFQAKKILELRHRHQVLISEALEITSNVFPIEADLDQQTFEYGIENLDEFMSPRPTKPEYKSSVDPLVEALQISALIDFD
jgi:hypothetical protein